MNFQNLEYFVTTANEKNFTKAAEQLYITQQTLSGQIASLERELGHKLFIRNKPLELTDAGRVVLTYATDLLRDYRKMETALSRLRPDGDNFLSIGVSFPGAIKHMGKFLGEYRRQRPGVQIRFVEHSGGDLMENLREGSVDIAVAHFSEHDPAFVRNHLFDEEIVILISDEHLRETFGSESSQVFEKICAGEYYLLEKCSYIRSKRNNIVARFADRFMEDNIPRPASEMVADSFVTQIEMCVSGGGFSFFPRCITADSLHSRALTPFRIVPIGEAAKFTVHYGYLDGSPRTALIEDFLAIAEKKRNGRTSSAFR